jgi:hypothetical protein
VITPLQQLRDQAAREFNWLLTEAPFQADGGWDFGWYCREHAFCTAVLGALLGVSCEVVRGDFLVSAGGGVRFSSIGNTDDHAWCRTIDSPVLDLSLHFKQFGPWPQLAEPIVRLGRNGAFDIHILPESTTASTKLGSDGFIGYIPRSVFHWSALELVSSPLVLLPTVEAAEISARVALHTFSVISRKRPSLAGVLPQQEALAQLRLTFPDAFTELDQLLDRAA